MILKAISVLELRIIKMHKEKDLVSVGSIRCARWMERMGCLSGASRWVGVLCVYLYGSWGCVVMDLGTSQRAFKVLHVLLLDQ